MLISVEVLTSFPLFLKYLDFIQTILMVALVSHVQ